MQNLQAEANSAESSQLKVSNRTAHKKLHNDPNIHRGEKKEKTQRKLYLNDSHKTKLKYKYKNNLVITSKYTWWNFFPKSLLLQFRRYANIYFLIITVLQCFPSISPLNPITAIGPFALVLLISIIREGMEDMAKHKQDEKENQERVMRYNPASNSYGSDLSYKLEVGDVIKISEFDVIPADCVLLGCSNNSKIAFIETANLDGEKNLKPKYCIPSVFEIFRNAQNTLRIRGTMVINKPKADLNAVEGQIKLRTNLNEYINPTHFLYKGTVLKNTKWAIAVVVYTGVETKIILNSERSPPKQSHIEALVNKLIGLIFLFQLILCVILAILNSVWFYVNWEKHTYLGYKKDNISYTVSGTFTFFSYLLLLNTMIPISLIVTIEMVKYAQAYFINVDTELFSRLRKTFAHCNSCSLNEELGQIKYIFSDKTGTLTMNKFEFKACVIGENLYGISMDKLNGVERGKMSSLKRASTFKKKEITMKINFSLDAFKDLIVHTYKAQPGKSYQNIVISSKNGAKKIKIDNNRDLVHHYFSCLSLNHTCFTDYKIKSGKEEKKRHTARPGKIPQVAFDGMIRNASSFSMATNLSQNIDENFDDYELNIKGNNPDEIVIVDAARQLGYIFTGGDQSTYKLKVAREYDGNLNYEDRRVEILKVLEFNSGRGMMSVIVREMNSTDAKIILYSKGGDTKIIDRCKAQTYQPFYNQVKDNATKLAEVGLRVLLIGMRVIEQEEFDAWKKDYETGLRQYENVDNLNENKIKYINGKYEEIERGLTLIGCTALEDKLQDQVPETIKELQTAGINVWVLTGDNLPTAKNIALMCNLIPKGMQVYELNNSLDKFKEKVAEILKVSIDSVFNDAQIEKAKIIIENYEQNLINDDRKLKDYYPQELIMTKSTLYAGLSSLLVHYYDCEKKDKGVLRGVLVECDILKNVLPPDGLNSIKYYGHPLTKLFLELTLNSQTVVCCRVAPKQKALVVSMVKKNIKGAITLAVGDGANDVTMIGVADVGVGLYGEEGSQAARESDYAIGEFKCLRRLILIHGRMNYIRIAEMILYFFFKNFIFTIPQFYYSFYSAFSGQTLYDDWYVSLYNMFFTSLPLLVKAILEQDVNDNDGEFVRKMIPYTYYMGREGLLFSIPQFLWNILLAVLESILLYFFVTYMMYYYIPQNESGFVADYWSVSLTQFTVIIMVF
jgi:phospholipid-transporting ATPase